MFPYRDENQTLRTPLVTIALIVTNVLVWLVVQGGGSDAPLARSVCNLGLIPAELTGLAHPGSRFAMGPNLACYTDPGPQYSHVLTSMFLHGSWAHLLGNMWFLWVFGDNVEDSMGRARYLIFYLLGGISAAILQVWMTPGSVVPMVGASGAISAVMGGYVVLYPLVRVFVMVPIGFYATSMALPAWTMVGYWALIQLVSGVVALGGPETGGVAFWAHVGGFIGGAVLVKAFARNDLVDARQTTQWAPRRAGWRYE